MVRRVLLALAAVLVVCAVVVGVRWLRTAQGHPLGEGSVSGLVPSDHDENAGGYTATYVHCQEGKPFVWTVSLVNRGHHGIEVEGFPIIARDRDATVWRMLRVRQARVIGPPDFDVDRGPFRPTQLAPSAELTVDFDGTFTDCHRFPRDSQVGETDVRVRVSRLGRTWVQTVPLHHSVIAMGCGRPRCAPNREA